MSVSLYSRRNFISLSHVFISEGRYRFYFLDPLILKYGTQGEDCRLCNSIGDSIACHVHFTWGVQWQILYSSSLSCWDRLPSTFTPPFLLRFPILHSSAIPVSSSPSACFRYSFLVFAFLVCEQVSSVSIVSGYGLDNRAIAVRSPAEAKGFFL
jgi:hypothetical protein